MLRRTFLKTLLGVAVAMPGAAGARSKPPPSDPLVLQRSPLAGFQFHDAQAVWGGLSPDDALDLIRERTNPHDHRAVAVHWRGQKLGYVPRTDNCTIAQLLDRGQPVSGRILNLKESNDPWQRITLEISLPVA
jgi:hypothetical protein